MAIIDYELMLALVRHRTDVNDSRRQTAPVAIEIRKRVEFLTTASEIPMVMINTSHLPAAPPADTIAAAEAQTSQSSKCGVPGEENYDGAREFNEAERKFVKSDGVDSAALAAPPKSAAEQQEMLAAEAAGRARAKDKGRAILHASRGTLTFPNQDAPQPREERDVPARRR